MADMEFPNRNNQSITTNNNSNNTSNNDDEAKKEKAREKRFQKLTSLLDGMNKNISKGLNKVGEQTSEVADEVTDQVFGSGLLVKKIKEGTVGIIKGIKNVSFKAFGGLISFMKADKRTRHYKLAKLLWKLRNGIIAPFNFIGKILRKINNGITFISEKVISGIGKTLKYILIGAGIFIKWLKNFLMKSMLFRAIGGIFKTIGSGISGLLGLGGDLVGSIAGKLVGSAAVSALTTGIKSLFSKATGQMLVDAIVKALPWAVVAAKLAAIAYGFRIGAAGDPDEDIKMNYINKGLLTADEAFAPGFDIKQWVNDNKDKINALPKSDFDNFISASEGKTKEQEYNEWIKQYPTLAKEILKARWLIDSDKDKNGIKDYSEENYLAFKNRIANKDYIISNPNAAAQYGISQIAVEELKNKSILGQAVGVTSNGVPQKQ